MDATRLRMPAMAMGFQSIALMNSPAILQRKAVAAIARIPIPLFEFSIYHPEEIAGGFTMIWAILSIILKDPANPIFSPQNDRNWMSELLKASPRRRP